MKRWRWRLALAGLALWTGLARAQAPLEVPVQVPVVETEPPPLEGGCAAGAGASDRRPLVGSGPQQTNYGAPGQIFYGQGQVAPPAVTRPTLAGATGYVPPNYPALQADPASPRPTRTLLQKCGVGCWSHVNSIGCGSLHADLQFIFGSCRSFFGEPCMHGPPPLTPATPMPPPNVAPYGVLALTPIRTGTVIPTIVP